MNKKILASSFVIMATAVAAIGATISEFSDTETSQGNTLSFGTVDIAVDGENPWRRVYDMALDASSGVKYVNFEVENVGTNDARIWKRITNVVNSGGDPLWKGVCSSEPEFDSGGGDYDTNGDPISGSYTERDNVSAFTVYDMSVCPGGLGAGGCEIDADGKPTGTGWVVVIDGDDQIRIDNIENTWVKIDDSLEVGQKLAVSQSYHLMAWDDSQQADITNWAQGDQMEFDIELEARQLEGAEPGDVQENVTLNLENKDPVSWDVIDGDNIGGTLTYKKAADKFTGTFIGDVSVADGKYCLIYYPDPWPGTGGIKIKCADAVANTLTIDFDEELNTDLPIASDTNHDAGAKFWVVLDADHDGSGMSGWNPASYLFDTQFGSYDDTGI